MFFYKFEKKKDNRSSVKKSMAEESTEMEIQSATEPESLPAKPIFKPLKGNEMSDGRV